MKRVTFIVLMALVRFADAQGVGAFHERLGVCKTQTDNAKRAQCFESIARDAVAKMEVAPVAMVCPAAPVCSAPPPIAKPNRYADDVEKAKALLTKNFKDPTSVLWRNVIVSEKHYAALCGELNAKNSYGGYIGFQKFLSVPSQDLSLILDAESSRVPQNFQGQWDIYCVYEVARVD